MSEEGESIPEDVEIVEEDELESLKMRVAELEQELQYYAADIANMRQKSAKERSRAIRFGSSSLAGKILPLLSGLERAISLSEGESGEGFLEGTKMTLRGFKAALESEGVTHIESLGKQFDPTKMEAVAMLPATNGIAPGVVIEVIEEGYMLHERVLRASRVIVADSDEDE
ncbi:MAG TPA: nucleotide exchange factor GrpE [Candidatus Thalassarchaeaceae archaeon]|nr:MAG TPA: nucleotide exchange factor GrpE [Candidatus Poseidoniales archaeon]HII34664.1 nucleotide exchange factor GrpE [Candidatus Thalassarchaeaceae archaeon]